MGGRGGLSASMYRRYREAKSKGEYTGTVADFPETFELLIEDNSLVETWEPLPYQTGHLPGNPIKYPDEIATIDRIVSSGFFPGDYLDDPTNYLYPIVSGKEYERILDIVRRAQGNPDMEVTVYRGSNHAELNPGDWITLSREYAEQYVGEGANSPNGKVYSYKVKAGELSFDGDALEEMGYWGKPKKARG